MRVPFVPLSKLRPSGFTYITLRESIALVSVAAADGSVTVIGHPEHGAYEWVYLAGSNYIHSNAGYGGTDSALRDGLIVALGDHPDDKANSPVIEGVIPDEIPY